MNECKNKNFVLSKVDVKRLREAYDNYNISIYYLNDEVKKSYEFVRNLSKEDAIEKIFKIIYL